MATKRVYEDEDGEFSVTVKTNRDTFTLIFNTYGLCKDKYEFHMSELEEFRDFIDEELDRVDRQSLQNGRK